MFGSNLLYYYQKELNYLKKYGANFSRKFPKIARRLGMSDGLSEDPHVERIIESFALLTAQIHQRLDADMPEVTDTLLSVIAPQLLRQFPSVCIVQMLPDSKTSTITSKNIIKSGAELFSKPINGHICRFRTVYPVTLLPLSLVSSNLQIDDSMRWGLKLKFSVWPSASVINNTLRLYINGPASIVHVLYTLLCSEVKSISFHHNDYVHNMNPLDIKAVGFDKEEGLFENDSFVSPAHTLLQDYFFFPQKFHFVDLPLPEYFCAEGQSELTYHFVFNCCHSTKYLDNIYDLIDKDTFFLNCTPAINLFEQRAEPIIPHNNTAEYPIIPDVRFPNALDVWSVKNVSVLRRRGDERELQTLHPLFGINSSSHNEQQEVYWQAIQRHLIDSDEMNHSWFIAFSDRGEKPLDPDGDIIMLSLTCTNRDLAAQLLNGDPSGDFESELPLSNLKINALTRPSIPFRAQVKQEARWRLISQLSLNHMLLSGPHGCQILKETLALYNFNNNPSNERLISLISQIEIKPIIARLIVNDPSSIARGVEITITFFAKAADEPEYFFLCRLLDYYLALYAPVNSFSRIVTRIDSIEGAERQWPIRAGRLAWL